MRPDPDLLLARRAASGQADAWDELVALYGRRLYNLAYQFTGDLAEAEDVTQEIFVRLYENLRRYRGEMPLVAWALRLSKNLCIDHYRRARRRGRGRRVSEEMLDRLPAAEDPQADAQRRQQLRLVYRALDEMPEPLAAAVLLRDLQGFSYEEAAAALDVPMGTLKSRLNRARLELAGRVERLGRPARPGAAPRPQLEVETC